MRCVIRAYDRPEICTAVFLTLRPNAGRGGASNFILLLLLKPYSPLETLTSDSLPPFRTVSGDCMPALRGVHKISKSDYRLLRACPSVRMEQLGSHWMDFYEIWYTSIFRKSVEKIQVPLKSANNGTSHVDRCTAMIKTRSILLRMTNDSEKVVEKTKTHFFLGGNRAVYKLMLKNLI